MSSKDIVLVLTRDTSNLEIKSFTYLFNCGSGAISDVKSPINNLVIRIIEIKLLL